MSRVFGITQRGISRPLPHFQLESLHDLSVFRQDQVGRIVRRSENRGGFKTQPGRQLFLNAPNGQFLKSLSSQLRFPAEFEVLSSVSDLPGFFFGNSPNDQLDPLFIGKRVHRAEIDFIVPPKLFRIGNRSGDEFPRTGFASGKFGGERVQAEREERENQNGSFFQVFHVLLGSLKGGKGDFFCQGHHLDIP